MTKPASLPLALATALHAAAVLFLPKPPPFALAADETGAPLAWAWLTPDVCVILDGATVGAPPPPDRADAIAAPILAALRRGVQEGAGARPAAEMDARAAEVLADATPLPEPFPCRGQQGLWTVDGEALAASRAAFVARFRARHGIAAGSP